MEVRKRGENNVEKNDDIHHCEKNMLWSQIKEFACLKSEVLTKYT